MTSGLGSVQELVKAKGYKWVYPRGDPSSPVWVCGEAPGQHEEQEGFAFVGPSGKEQNKMLTEVGFLDPLFFCNPYSVRPPDNKMDRFDELGIPRKEFEDEFLTTLHKYQPKIVIPVGETSARLLCPDTVPKRKSGDKGYIHKWMGSLLRSPLLQWDHYVIPNLHPAYILRNWGERVVACLIYGKAFEELEYLRAHGSLQPLPRRNIKHKLTSDQVLEELSKIPSGSVLAFDIEMLHRKHPYTISFATDPWNAIAFKLWGHGAFGRPIFRELDRILSTCTLIGQNCFNFDGNWLNSVGFDCNIKEMIDIMVRHHVRWPELRHRLAFTVMQYTREPFYKEEGRGWSPKDPIDRFLLYNGKDSCCTYEVYLAQEKEFNDEHA